MTDRSTGWVATLPGIAVLIAARAAGAAELSAGDTAWMLTSSALVLMMTLPGLALFYGGLDLRVTDEVEFAGIDLSEHSETARATCRRR